MVFCAVVTLGSCDCTRYANLSLTFSAVFPTYPMISVTTLPSGIPFPLPPCSITDIIGNDFRIPHGRKLSDAISEANGNSNAVPNAAAESETSLTYTVVPYVVPPELRSIWLNHWTPSEFHRVDGLSDPFREACDAVMKRLFDFDMENILTRSQDEAADDDARSQHSKADDAGNTMSPLLNGIRIPDIHECIELAAEKELADWDTKVNNETRMKIKKFLATANSDRLKSNRFGCKVDWFLSSREAPWSEINLLNTMRSTCSLETFKLVYDYNSTRFVKTLVSHNFASNPHKSSESKLLVHLSDIERDGLKKVDPSATIISVSFYHPVRGHKMAEFDILDSQTLSNLRDAFSCDESRSVNANLFTGSVFFIDGILYADTRDESALDYSVDIGQFFMEKSPEKLRSTHGVPQHFYTFREMTVPLNTRCSFLHLGDCEHRVVFTSMRRYNDQYDSCFEACYPVRVFEPSTKVKTCDVCLLNASTKLVFNSSFLPKNPMAVCLSCASAGLNEHLNPMEDSDMFQCDYVETV